MLRFYPCYLFGFKHLFKLEKKTRSRYTSENAKASAVLESAYLRCIICISLEATLNPSRFLCSRILVTSACICDKSGEQITAFNMSRNSDVLAYEK